MSRTARESTALARALVPVLALAVALALWGIAPVARAEPTTGDAYVATGPEVAGAASQAQAPLLTPGIHLDTFALGGSGEDDLEGTAKYYRVAVSPGQRVHASVTVAAPPYADGLPEAAEGLSMGLTFLTAGGEDCEDTGDDGVGHPLTGDGPISSSAVSGTAGWDGCAGDELFLRVTRTGLRAAETPLPVEIQVAIEPAGVGGGAPSVSEEIDDDGASPVAPAEDGPLTPGRSFATAPEVEPGSYLVELVPGEVGLVRIQVQEGQRLRWRVEETSAPEDAGEIALRVANAVRQQVAVRGGSWRLNPADRVAGGGMTAPVDLGNRGSDLTSVASAWLPGTHYVTLQRLQRPAGADPAGDAPVTLVLTLEVEGEPAEGGPEGTVLELGETGVARGPLSSMGVDASWSRLAMVAGAGLLGLLGVVTGVAGLLVLRLRRA